jgi:hypothetical protein
MGACSAWLSGYFFDSVIGYLWDLSYTRTPYSDLHERSTSWNIKCSDVLSSSTPLLFYSCNLLNIDFLISIHCTQCIPSGFKTCKKIWAGFNIWMISPVDVWAAEPSPKNRGNFVFLLENYALNKLEARQGGITVISSLHRHLVSLWRSLSS